MPLSRSGVLYLSIAAVVLSGVPALAAGAEKLTPSEIQKIFVIGKPFAAIAPSGKAVTIIFNPDGSASAVPKGKKKGTKGKWRASDTGYCTTWGKGSEQCYTVRKAGEQYEVMNQRAIVVARWTAP